ncbi:MAG TPA: DUF2279 domain-containing protein, partial [Spirochaetota bacterium]|nr:DUF2279 domain-containing protein [Spirochaetota bacterium]
EAGLMFSGSAGLFTAPASAVNSSVKDASEKKASEKTMSAAEGKLIMRYAILVSVPLTTYLFAWLSWDWGNVRANWKWANEGWFGRNTYSGGADKLGHIFSHYVMFRAMYAVFNYTEDGRYTKWVYSVVLPSMLALGIELGDAFSSSQNGFAYEDMICGFTGIAIGVIMEKFPVVDSFFGISVEYFPSKYMQRNMDQITKFVDDYSGWKFMLNFKLSGFRDMGFRVPQFLRYVMFDLGYYTRGFTKYDREVGDTSRKRSVFIGFSINMAEVIDDLFPDKHKKVAHYLKQPFYYIHIPLGYSHGFEVD